MVIVTYLLLGMFDIQRVLYRICHIAIGISLVLSFKNSRFFLRKASLTWIISIFRVVFSEGLLSLYKAKF